MSTICTEIVALRPGSGGPPLFCAHDGHFAAMAALMPDDVPIYGLRPLNLAQADVDLTVEQLAQSHLQDLLKVQSRGPYLLLGYSFGGLIAYEVATQLKHRGEQIRLLGLVDSHHPEFRANLSSVELDVVQKTYVSDRKSKYLTNLRNGDYGQVLQDAMAYAKKKLQPLIWSVLRFCCRLLDLPLPRSSISLRIEAMSAAYRPAPYAGQIVLFQAEGRAAEFANDPTMGWHRSADRVEVTYARGLHEAMMALPNVTHLVEQVTACMRKAASAAVQAPR